MNIIDITFTTNGTLFDFDLNSTFTVDPEKLEDLIRVDSHRGIKF